MLLLLIILAIVLLAWLGFKEEILNVLSVVAVFAGVGALIFWIAFGNARLGALVGGDVAVLLIIKLFTEAFGMTSTVSGVIGAVYYVISLPFYVLNQMQILLSRPWRPFTKRNTLPGNVKRVLEPVLEVIGILLIIAITPLRALNAAYYNIIVHGLTEFYDFFLEVLRPSCSEEGGGTPEGGF